MVPAVQKGPLKLYILVFDLTIASMLAQEDENGVEYANILS